MFETIVVAVDGSETGERAFGVAREMATEGRSRLVVVHVTDLVAEKGGGYKGPVRADEGEFRDHLRSRISELHEHGLAADLVIESTHLGGPAHVIAEIAASEKADLIVVGSRGRSPIAGLMLGSVPMRLLHIGHRPMLIVPPSV